MQHKKSPPSANPDFQLLFESVPGLYLVLTPELRIVAVSNAYLQATMTEREKILGRHLFEIFPDNPDDPLASGTRNLGASLQRVLKNRTADAMVIQKYDIRKPETEGGGFEERYWSPVNSPAFDAKGNIVYLIHRVEDVTEFVRLKQKGHEQSKLTEELHDRAEKMESEIFLRAQEVAEANQKLENANKELARLYDKTKELDRLKTDFFANVSHELRTPLTLILGPVVQMLSNPETPVTIHGDLEMIERNARLLLKRVNDLLDISKLEAGKMTLRYVKDDLAQLIRRICAHFESFAHQKNVRVSVQAPSALIGEVDREKLERILLNLLSNAFKFTPSEGEIELQLERKDKQALFTISDTGPGIPENVRETIFERFRQVDSHSQRRVEGTGLGLSIVKEFTLLHGGTVTVDKSPKGGARLKVAIPLNAPSGVAVEESEKDAIVDLAASVIAELRHHAVLPDSQKKIPADRQSWKGSVLVVEDSMDMRLFISKALGKNHHVETAINGKQGLEVALRTIPDLIISDVMMPEMSGDEMAHELLSYPETCDIPLLLLTAKMDDSLKMTMLKEGVRDYIAKPFSPEELSVKVDRLIAERKKILAARAHLIQRLEKSNEDLERFAYTASHDLRSPLRGIENLASMLEEDMGDALQGDNKIHMTILRGRVKRMEKLLDDLLDYARLDNVLEKTTVEIVDAAALVRDIVFVLSPSDKYGVVTGKEMEGMQIPRYPLQQVLHNLIDNAIKHHDKKKGTITISVHEDADGYIFSVRDDGPGIAPQYHQRIFEMFQTLQPRDRKEGSGLGLAFVRKILLFYNSDITVISEPGSGAEFRFYWPKNLQERTREKKSLGHI